MKQNAIAHGAINTGECITGYENELCSGLWHIRAAYDRDEGPQLGTSRRNIEDGESFHFDRYENTDAIIHSTFRVAQAVDNAPEYVSIRSKITAAWDAFVAWVNARLGYE